MQQELKVKLSNDILSLTGTVNDVEYPWRNMGGGFWQTVAAKSPDQRYRLKLTAVNALGIATEFDLTLYYGLNLITDRTQSDVDLRTDKGFYNASDLNRVGAAVAYLKGLLQGYGYTAAVNPRQDWTVNDLPTNSEMQEYLLNVENIRNAIAISDDTPNLPNSMNNLDFEKANDIEKILLAVDKSIMNMEQTFYYSNEIFTAEVQ